MRAHINQNRQIENKEGRTFNKKTNTFSGNKKKENIKDIVEPDDAMVRGIPEWKLEPNGANPGNNMVCNVKTYFWCTNNHDRGIWVCQ